MGKRLVREGSANLPSEQRYDEDKGVFRNIPSLEYWQIFREIDDVVEDRDKVPKSSQLEIQLRLSK
jgi:hypothetical protein